VYWPYACRGLTRVVLGNHDVKGCQAVCAPDGTLVSDHRAYEQRQAGGETKACNAFVALAYPEFGFPKLSGEDDTLPHNQRYHETLFPADAPTVKVLGLDSNTLGAEKGLLEEDLPPGHTSCTGVVEDEAQLRWLHERLRPEPGRGVEDRPWTIVAMHHPAFTPRGCSIAWFGCHGGHQDQPGIQYQLRRSAAPSFVPAAQEPGAAAAGERAVPPADVPRDAELAMPDLVFGAHNHFYARSFAVDPWGERCAEHPALTPPDPVRCRPGRVSRHFVSGGGGAPLYALGPRHDRWAEAIRLHHFVYLRLLPKVAFFWTIDRTGRVRDSGCFQKGDARELRIHGARWFDPVGPENCRLPAEVEPPPR
jgi:hypothetical protein